MNWLGHVDSEMVRHYYYLHDELTRLETNRLNMLGVTDVLSPTMSNLLTRSDAEPIAKWFKRDT